MTRWARLTWQAPEPGAFAAALAARLGVESRAGAGPDTHTLDLGAALLEVRGWIRESPADAPSPGGRLMLEPVPAGEPAPEDDDPAADRPLRLAGTGWATVELDRAEDELGMWLGDGAGDTGDGSLPPDAAEPHLGALARVRPAGGLPGDSFVLLEPSTEGRLAASLARDSEGPCALYLRPAVGLTAWSAAARRRGVRLSARRAGPLGTEVLLVGGPIAGPHLLVVDARRSSKRNAATGTIAP
jgi:hypothetical protein